MNSLDVRTKLVEALRMDLVGPGNDHAFARELLPESPSRWYFKGTWLHRFTRGDTRMAPFFVSPAKSVSAMTMMTTARIPYGEEESLTLVQLPYIPAIRASI